MVFELRSNGIAGTVDPGFAGTGEQRRLSGQSVPGV
jgi:hypothetical protein